MSQIAESSKPTLDQRRARHAWEAVLSAKSGKGFKDFCGQATRLPIRIMASGLGQALAFLKAKDYAPQLLKEIGDWVLDKRADPTSVKPKPSDDALIRKIIASDSDFLRRATDETLAYLQWLNRFAEAEEPPTPSEGG
jgi:CRISPR-associated protein Cmr5